MRFCPKCKAETERKKNGDCKPCAAIYNKAYAAAHKDEIRAYHISYRETNKEILNAAAKAWKAANTGRQKFFANAWSVANPEKRKASKTNRRALKNASAGKHTASDIKVLFALQKGKCAYCKVNINDSYHTDHIIPLSKKGGNDKYNLQLLCPTCNLSKGAKHPIDFMQSRGLLL